STMRLLELSLSGAAKGRAGFRYDFGVAQSQADGLNHAPIVPRFRHRRCDTSQKFRACTHKSAFCKRGSVNVRFAPKATKVLRCRELTRCATNGCEQAQQDTSMWQSVR